MNKGDLVDSISAETGLSKKDVGRVIDGMVENITYAMAQGEKVTLVGFGSFETKNRHERIGRNPKTGDTMTIPAAKVPRFSAGKVLKQKIAAPNAEVAA